MNSRIMLVVGDKFASYAQGKDAITVSQLRGLLSFPAQFLPGQGRIKLIPGQGMGDQCIAKLLGEATHSPNREHFDFSLWHQLPKRASQALTHKHREENRLISEPRQLSEDVYELHLMIDEEGELMHDHQSGQHVQGMLLIEAVRQATVAITESYYIQTTGIDYAFVLNDMSVKYNNFSFPVPATITCRVVDKSLDNPRRLSFSMEADVVQCGACVSSLTFAIAAMDKERIHRQENRQAQKAQQHHMQFFAATEAELDEPVSLTPIH
ncbi:AfsA-related hotdog domain-containing protein [Gilvimarinus algae]|uniref:AfsA-related hotdog domain-containing protein n=1 Tax=Gilvimarinus algae TaxID=3058037 RepID=A0ABT8TL76_9GAMM|nr:AfsA-related hotdog domain-containing protein [Gilvimarinus sp. SDUM040014]MDO3383097.1 AfsA-related hotdog domain-containing protein [Gilvimarinus sp. SDUM040014]